MLSVSAGDVITFTEYERSQLSGRKRIIQRMENMTVVAVIEPGDELSRDQISEYFGEDLDNKLCVALSVAPVRRLILKADDEQKYCVNLVNDFLNTGMQTIELCSRRVPAQAEAPSYLQFLDAFGSVT